MLLFLSSSPEPFTVTLEYVKDLNGNIVAVTIPIAIWNSVLRRYRTLLTNEDTQIKEASAQEPS